MAGEIEKSVDLLESLFQKSESNLNHIERKLELQFQKDGLSKEENPVKLMKRVIALKKEYLEFVEEAKKLQEAQKDITDYYKEQVSRLLQLSARVDTKLDIPNRDPSVELQAVGQMLGISVDHYPPSPGSQPPPQKKLKKEAENSGATQVEDLLSGTEDTSLSPASKRNGTEEFQSVTPEEFQTVSSSFPKQIKLVDINHCYRILWQHFKVEKNIEALTPKEMFNMGLKVSGLCGQAKLKVLQSLKLLQLSNKGSVKLL
ncbi:spindle and kinetochore-associated protein 2-like [Argonauta hians]